MKTTPNRRILSLSCSLLAVFALIHTFLPYSNALLIVHTGSALIAVASCVGWSLVMGKDASRVIGLFAAGLIARGALGFWATGLAELAAYRNEIVLMVVGYLFAEIAILAFGSNEVPADPEVVS